MLVKQTFNKSNWGGLYVMAKLQSLSIGGKDISVIIRNTMLTRNILFIGDSYAAETASYTGNTGASTGWPQNCSNNVYGLNNYFVVAKGGACFGKSDDYAASTLLNNWLNSTEGLANKDKITDVVFGFGYNECYALYANGDSFASKVVNGIIDCNNLIASNMPLAKPWLFSVGWGSNPNVRIKADNCYNNLYPSCTLVKWAYCQAHPIMYNPAFYADDRVHPNDEGMFRLGQYIANCLNYGNTDMIRLNLKLLANNSVGFGFMQTTSPSQVNIMLLPNVIFNNSSDFTHSNDSLHRLCAVNAFTLGSLNNGSSTLPAGDFCNTIMYHIAGSSVDKYVEMPTCLVSVSVGTKYGHEIFDTVVSVRNRTGSTLQYSKAAPESGKYIINPYYV